MDSAYQADVDEMGPALVRVVEPCAERCGRCDICLEAAAGLHMNALLFGRWLVQTGRCTDQLPDDPEAERFDWWEREEEASGYSAMPMGST